MENPYKYSGGENDPDEEPVPIFYDTFNFFLPFTLILITFAVPILINEYIVKLGNKYPHILMLYIFIVWPLSTLRMLNYFGAKK